MFEQSAEESDRNRGLGLGLPIARRIVEMHGGTIAAHSDGPGRGSRFTIVVVPERPAASTAMEADPHEEWLIDEAIRQSFPASDPAAFTQPGSLVGERYARRANHTAMP
jgi:hypothetical protein